MRCPLRKWRRKENTRKFVSEKDARVAELKARVDSLNQELQARDTKEELAVQEAVAECE